MPTTFGNLADFAHDRLYISVLAGRHHYRPEFDFASDCKSVSGASDGGNRSLWWRDRGIENSLVTRISDRATLTRIVNSAILNGPVQAV